MLSAKRLVVRALNGLCAGVDAVAYRPAVVRLGRRLPRWWNCQLAKLSIRLDDRWQTGYWNGDIPRPVGPCEACGRKAALWVIGCSADVPDRDSVREGDDDSFMAHRQVHIAP